MTRVSRRNLLGGLLAGIATGGMPLEAQDERARLKAVVTGGHPADPMAGCGGTMARLADLGHEVVALCLPRGEAGIRGKSHDETAAIRSEEARKSCEILKARLRFVGQIDGATEIHRARYDEFRAILEEEKPDWVFTHWPIDGHRDHRVISMLVFDAWLKSKRKFALCYFEVETGDETQQFVPTHYVDITEAEPRKREALMEQHLYKTPPHLYSQQEIIHRFRGMEAGTKFAEAFSVHVQNRAEGVRLPLGR